MMQILMLYKSSHLSIALLYFDGNTLESFCEAGTFLGSFSWNMLTKFISR